MSNASCPPSSKKWQRDFFSVTIIILWEQMVPKHWVMCSSSLCTKVKGLIPLSAPAGCNKISTYNVLRDICRLECGLQEAEYAHA